MAKKTGGSPMARDEIVALVRDVVTSGAADEAALARVIGLLHAAKPHWDWIGIYLLVDETLHLGPVGGAVRLTVDGQTATAPP
jgi:putative methionine-R-sulfoxide reductase with GAF domain